MVIVAGRESAAVITATSPVLSVLVPALARRRSELHHRPNPTGPQHVVCRTGHVRGYR
jgi:hypothetical protein